MSSLKTMEGSMEKRGAKGGTKAKLIFPIVLSYSK